MDFTIKVLGDISYLAETIRASSAILGFADFKVLLGIGFLLGIIWILMQGVSSGGSEVKIGNIIVAGLMYAAFFGVTVDDVKIQQERTVIGSGGGSILAPSRIEVVDDVPIGLATAGMIISNMGSEIADWYRTEFSRPGMDGIDPLFALEMLTRMKDVGFDSAAVNWDPTGLVQAGLDRYVEDCTMIGLTLEDNSGQVAINKEDIKNAGDGASGRPGNVWEAIKLNNNLYRTKVIYQNASDNEVAENLGCAEAHDKIGSELLGTDMTKEISANLVQSTCASNTGNGICPRANVGSVTRDQFVNEASTTFESVAKAYIRSDLDVTKQFMNRIALGALARSQARGGVATEGDVFIQAIAGRASSILTQNQALQSTIFERTMTPLMTFFEAMMYIAAPFAAFLVTLGIGGISLIGKYLVFAVWIQLWKPVSAAIELYIEMVSTGAMASLSDYSVLTAGELGTIARDPEMFTTISHWLGTGSMLLAATPAITLMLIYGSAVTASSLAGRVDAASNVDAGVDNLDGKEDVGAYKGQLTPTGNGSIGTMANASDGQGTYDIQGAYNQAFTQSAAKEESFNKTATERIGQGSEAAVEGITSYQNAISQISSNGAGNQTLEQWSEGAASKLATNGQISDTEQATTASAISMGVSAGASGGKGALEQTRKTLMKNGVNNAKDWGTAKLASAASMLSAKGDIKGTQDYREIGQKVDSMSDEQVASVNQQIQEGQSAFSEERSSFNEAYNDTESFKTSEKSFAQAEDATQRATSLKDTRQAAKSTVQSMGGRFKIAGSDLAANLRDPNVRDDMAQYIDSNKKEGDPLWDGVDSSPAGIKQLLNNSAQQGDIKTFSEVAQTAGLMDPFVDGMNKEGGQAEPLMQETESATDTSVDDTYNQMKNRQPAANTLKPADQKRFKKMFGEGSEEILNKTYGSDFDSVANQAIDGQIENKSIDRNLLGGDFDKLTPEQKMDRVSTVAAEQQDRSNGAREAFEFVEYLGSEEGQESLNTTGMTAGGGAVAGAGIGAMIAKRMGSGMLAGASRGGKIGALAGLAIGGYQAYGDYQDAKMEEQLGDFVGGDETRLRGLESMENGDEMREYLNNTMTSVAGDEFNARKMAQNSGEEFDANAFRENLSPFEQQVYDNFGTLSESSQTQGFRDDLAGRAEAMNKFRGREMTGLSDFGWGGASRSVAQIDSALTSTGQKYEQFVQDQGIDSIQTNEQEQEFYSTLGMGERQVYAARAELGGAGYGSQVENQSFFDWRDNQELVDNYRSFDPTLGENFGVQRPDMDAIANAYVDVPDTVGANAGSNYIPSIGSVGQVGKDFEYNSVTSGGVQGQEYSLATTGGVGGAGGGAGGPFPQASGTEGVAGANPRFEEMRGALEQTAPHLLPNGGQATPENVQSIDQQLQDLESQFIVAQQQNGEGYTIDQFAAETPMTDMEADIWNSRDDLMQSGFGGSMAAGR